MSSPVLVGHQRRQAGRLFAALAHGERLACQCAQQQSGIIDCNRSRRFLQEQARQERSHAWLFEQAAEWLDPGSTDKVPAGLLVFGRRLERALARGDLVESLLASQIVLEGAGEQILLRLNQGMDRYGAGFSRIRQMILRQEQSHHAFGQRTLHHQIGQQQIVMACLHELADSYLVQMQGIFIEMSDVFAALDEDIDAHINGVKNSLPAWILPDQHDFCNHSHAE